MKKKYTDKNRLTGSPALDHYPCSFCLETLFLGLIRPWAYLPPATGIMNCPFLLIFICSAPDYYPQMLHTYTVYIRSTHMY
jgi:hypothetical protein